MRMALRVGCVAEPSANVWRPEDWTQAVAQPTIGTGLIDALVDGVQIGDNLVMQAADGALLDLITARFVAAHHGQVPLVVIPLLAPWEGPADPDLTVLDWSPVVTGRPSPHPDALEPDATFSDALSALEAVDERVGVGAAFVFDRLSAVEEVWGGAAALDLFLTACPRLYRRRSLALWPVERARHRPTFLRRLAEITQVVVEIDGVDDAYVLTVREADGRPVGVIGRSVEASLVDGDLQATEPPTSTRQRLGALIREQRLRRGLSQAELARRVEVTPSALSQVERGVRGPSGDTLMRLWETLGVPFGPEEVGEDGYHVSRRSGRERTVLQEGLVAERIVDEVAAGQAWRIEIAPGASGTRPPFAVKRPEVAVVVRGIVDVTVGGRSETLQEGDGIVLYDAVVSGWANPSMEPAELTWYLSAQG